MLRFMHIRICLNLDLRIPKLLTKCTKDSWHKAAIDFLSFKLL